MKNFNILRQQMSPAALEKSEALAASHIAISTLLTHINNGVDLAVHHTGRLDNTFIKTLIEVWAEDPEEPGHRAIHINLRGVKTEAELLNRFVTGFGLNLSVQHGHIAIVDAMYEMLKDFGNKHQVMVVIEPAGKIALFRNIEGWLRGKVQFLSRVSFVFVGTKKDIQPMFCDRNRPFYKQALIFNLNASQRFVGGHEEMVQELMERPGFKEAYKALDEEFIVYQNNIRARKESESKN